MAKLLRLHLTGVGHKDARFHPLTLDFRGRDGHPSDTVLWLRNGGGKSSLLNLFYTTFLPESRKFLGSRAESRERRLGDYVKAGDLAFVVTEWEMPAGTNLFSATRIVGQALAWHGGAVSTDESRLDREFFMFRGSEVVPFEELPVAGLGAQPVTSLQGLRDWLTTLETRHRGLEVERCNQRQKGLWREKLDRVGMDTELFSYQLTMNTREGGAAQLFEIKDTAQFIDLFLEMAMPPQPCADAAAQIALVREKLLKLPQRELEDRFLTATLGELRPLAHDAATLQAAKAALRGQRECNGLLRAAIEHSIQIRQARLITLDGEIIGLQQLRDEANTDLLSKQEYRRNYDHLFRDLRWEEAQKALEAAGQHRQAMKLAERVAEAAIRWDAIAGREQSLQELRKQQAALRAEQKPVLEELHRLGAALVFALEARLHTAEEVQKACEAVLAVLRQQREGDEETIRELVKSESAVQTEFRILEQRLTARNQRREELRIAGLLQPKERAAAALERCDTEAAQLRDDIENTSTRLENIERELTALQGQESERLLNVQKHETEAERLRSAHDEGTRLADALRASRPIREVLTSDAPDIEFAELPRLLLQRSRSLLEEIFRQRLDHVDDERTLQALETERLFPPSREVETVLAHLRAQTFTTALPAYRYLAANARDDATAEALVASDPARFSGVFVQSRAEFDALRETPLHVAGLRHPVAISLTDLSPSDPGEIVVALPQGAGAFNYQVAAALQGTLQDRLEAHTQRLEEIDAARSETTTTSQQLDIYRRDFGAGRLAQWAQEREQHAAELVRLETHRQSIANARKGLLDEKAQAEALLKDKQTRQSRFGIDAQRLRNYHDDYDQHADEWLRQRDEKSAARDRLAREIAEAKRALGKLDETLDASRQRLTDQKSTVTQLHAEKDAVSHRDAAPPAAPLALNAARTSYSTASHIFDERYGDDALAGQISLIEADLVRARADHSRDSQGLAAEDIAAAAQKADLRGELETAKAAHLDAFSAHSAAQSALADADRERKRPRAFKQGLGLPPGAPLPETAAQAADERDRFESQSVACQSVLDDANVELSRAEGTRTELAGKINARRPHLTTLDDLTEPSGGTAPTIPDDDNTLLTLVDAAKRDTTALSQAHQAALLATTRQADALLRATRRDEFASLPAAGRERFAGLPHDELLERSPEFVLQCEARQTVLRDEIARLTEDKDLVIRQLDGVAREALRLLGKAERASTMPEAFVGWSGQPFLRITTQPPAEPAARRDRLGALVDRLVQEKAIPDGTALASAAVREVGGVIRATVLKPEDPLRPDRHEIVDFGAFSGGEKMTAAILLYTTLAQLRARGRESFGAAREAGVLILDNPFGTASKREFVELQLRVARQMGVQLIYATGVNDLGALDVLPHILRLRKRHRDRRSGDLLVSEDDSTTEEAVEGVRANLHE